MASAAQAQGEVTAGATVYVVGATSDHDKGVDGFDTLYNRIVVDYANTLGNGLEIKGKAAVFVVKDAIRPYDPGVSYVSVGGGFGTVTMGHHAPAVHATLPFPYFGVDTPIWVHYTLFTGLPVVNSTFAWHAFGSAPASITYATPTMGGLTARVTYAPNFGADPSTSVRADGPEDYMAAAAAYEVDMGGAIISLGAGMQTAADDAVDSMAAVGKIEFGGAAVAAGLYDNGDMGTEGMSVSAKYTLGSITPSITYAELETAMGMDQSVLAVTSSYEVGGGFSAFVEYVGLEVGDDDETLLLSGVVLDF